MSKKSTKPNRDVSRPLTAEHVALLDRLRKEEALARKYQRHVRQAQKLRAQLDAIFGEFVVGTYEAEEPEDSRAFIRVTDTKEYPPLEAKTVEVVRYMEFPRWDV